MKSSQENRYYHSERFLQYAEQFIPLGAQTFSKSKTQYPHGVSPYFIEKGLGSRVWDIDGNQYIDFVNSLAAITLGYQDSDVDKAVRAQLQKGVSFSLPHRLEAEVAEMIVDMVPCAEQVRFGKNGSDATAGAVRLARAYTNKEHVLVCGYHGWQDWYIGSTARNLGVPKATQSLTHVFQYNDIESLINLFDRLHGNVAAVILEPMNITFPNDKFLEKVKSICHKNHAILIFDEVITGFRFANGGAQEYFGVTPDLATFGKGLANGFPLSAIAGKKEIMRLMEDIFFSFTFGGETLSLAASKAVLQKLQKNNVCEHLALKGKKVIFGVNELINKHNVSSILSVSGHPSWNFLNITGNEHASSSVIKTFYLQEIFKRGVLSLGSHNMSFSHSDNDIDTLLSVYDEVFDELSLYLKSDCLLSKIRCKVLEPLFSVRKSGCMNKVMKEQTL